MLLSMFLACTFELPLAGDAPDSPAPPPSPEPEPEPEPLRLEHRPGTEGPVFSSWAVGDELFVASHGVNLRASPSTSSDVVHELALGYWVKVVGVSETIETIGVTNRWYEVEGVGIGKGFIFGSLLTPELHRADLDADGETELVTLGPGPDFAARVRVWDRLELNDPIVQTLDIPGPGGTLSLDAKDGLAVVVCSPDCVKHPLAYLPDAIFPELGHLVPADGEPASSGFREYTKPRRVFWEYYETEPMDETGDRAVTCDAVGSLTGVLWEGKRIIVCSEYAGGSPRNMRSTQANATESWSVFIERSPTAWTEVHAGGEDQRAIDAILKEKRSIRLTPELHSFPASLAVFSPPETLAAGPWGSLKRSFHSDHTWEEKHLVKAFSDPNAGDVYTTRPGDVMPRRGLEPIGTDGDFVTVKQTWPGEGLRSGAFYLRQPGGHYFVYDYAFEGPLAPPTRNERGVFHHVRDCDGAHTNAVVDVDPADLQEVEGSNPTRYVPIAADHPLNLQLLGEGEDPEAFLASKPYFLWKNPWGTYLRFTEKEQRQCVRSGKSLYLYPPSVR